MDDCGASSQCLEVCTQEKSIITLTNGGGGDFNQKFRKKEKKTTENKMTHEVQSSVSLMKSINNVTFLTLLCLKESSRIINPGHGEKLKGDFFSQVHFQLGINVKQMFGNTLMVSVQLTPTSLKQTLALATKTNPQPVYIHTGALALYKQTASVARGLIRRRPTNPIKSPFVPLLGVCLKA